jgi:hypothetical protein
LEAVEAIVKKDLSERILAIASAQGISENQLSERLLRLGLEAYLRQMPEQNERKAGNTATKQTTERQRQ